ncbi:BAH [Musa troglodytarum]|uniref:BAH n=1 Tax=Musa troglodytarum TaxID=320322 RepID=A0A9E7L3W5_9LILI|nr:BAH [Musa troglodytarum]
MVPRSSFSPITMMCRALTPSRASALSILSKTIPSWRMLVPRTTSAALSTKRPPGRSPLTASPCRLCLLWISFLPFLDLSFLLIVCISVKVLFCITGTANVRCLTTLTISWSNVRDARIGK